VVMVLPDGLRRAVSGLGVLGQKPNSAVQILIRKLHQIRLFRSNALCVCLKQTNEATDLCKVLDSGLGHGLWGGVMVRWIGLPPMRS